MTQDEIDRIFHALADATRRDIVQRVMRSDLSVSSLAEAYLMSFAAVQKHVAVLEKARLVRKARRGREQLVSGDVDTIRKAERLLRDLEEIWKDRIGRMHAILAEEGDGAAPAAAPRTTPASPTQGTDA